MGQGHPGDAAKSLFSFNLGNNLRFSLTNEQINSQGTHINEDESLWIGHTGESRCFSLLFTIVKIGFSESPHCL